MHTDHALLAILASVPSPPIVTATARVEAPVARVFSVLSNYEQVVQVIDGLESLTPVAEPAHEVGARFAAVFRLPGRQVSAEVVLAELVENRRVLWEAAGTPGRSVLFDTKQLEPSLTAVRVSVSFERGGGIAGSLLAPIIEETVRSRARNTLEHLKGLNLAGS